MGWIWYGALDSATNRGVRTTTPFLVADGWQHFVCVYDHTAAVDDRAKIYRNGILDHETLFNTGTPTAIPNGTARLAFGGSVGSVGSDNTDAPAYPYIGNLSDVRLYDKVITSTEAAQLYEDGNIPDDNLVGWWLRDGKDLRDWSRSRNDGSSFGSTYSIDGPA